MFWSGDDSHDVISAAPAAATAVRHGHLPSQRRRPPPIADPRPAADPDFEATRQELLSHLAEGPEAYGPGEYEAFDEMLGEIERRLIAARAALQEPPPAHDPGAPWTWCRTEPPYVSISMTAVLNHPDLQVWPVSAAACRPASAAAAVVAAGRRAAVLPPRT